MAATAGDKGKSRFPSVLSCVLPRRGRSILCLSVPLTACPLERFILLFLSRAFFGNYINESEILSEFCEPFQQIDEPAEEFTGAPQFCSKFIRVQEV